MIASNLLELPQWLLLKTTQSGISTHRGPSDSSQIIPEGQRNNTLASIAGAMRWRGLSQEAIAAVLLIENEKRCDPPLPEEEVLSIAESYARYEPGSPTKQNKVFQKKQKDVTVLPDEIENLISTIKDNHDPGHVFDSVDDLAGLSRAAFGKVKAALKDILRDKLNLNDLERAVNEARQHLGSSVLLELDEHGLPVIPVNDRPLREISADALQALEAANDPPEVFMRGSALGRVRSDEHSRARIELLDEDRLKGRLARVANMVIVRDETVRHVSPPKDVVRDILSLGRWTEFPSLQGVIESPALRPDGTVLHQAGYDAATQLFYAPPPGFVLPPISERPQPDEARAAASFVLEELLGDFPFAPDAPMGDGSASQTHALALLLTCVLRPLIDGAVPLALISAPQRGSGKTLLADLVSLVATGKDGAMMVAPRCEEEWRKRITAMLSTGAALAIIDNVSTMLGATGLDAVLTARVWEDRILGRSEMVVFPHKTVWIATANNPIADGDLIRRCYSIRLDAELTCPWQRTGFRHPDISQWAVAHRGPLLAALLTMGRAWFEAGQPLVETPMLGKFEVWTRTLSGVLAVAQVPHFLDNLQQLYEHIDPESQQMEGWLTAWRQYYGEQPVTVAMLVERMQKSGSLLQVLLPDDLAMAWDRGEGHFQMRLGRALAKHEGVRYGEAGLHLVRAGKDTRKNVVKWQVRTVSGLPGLPGFSPPLLQKKPCLGREEKSLTPEQNLPGNPANPVQTLFTPSRHEGDETSNDNTSDDDADDAEPGSWVLPQSSLPTDISEWPQDWRLINSEFEYDFVVEEGLNSSEAKRRAEEKTRQWYLEEIPAPPVIIPRSEVDILDQITVKLGLDLEALSKQLGIPLCPPSIDDAKILWQRLAQYPAEILGLDIYLYRFIEMFETERSRQNHQRFEAFRQQSERYGHLDLGSTFQDVEYTAFEYGLDLLELSTQFGMNLCNLTFGEVCDLRRRILVNWNEAPACMAYMSDAELKGFEQYLLRYEEAYERLAATQSHKKRSWSPSRNQRRR